MIESSSSPKPFLGKIASAHVSSNFCLDMISPQSISAVRLSIFSPNPSCALAHTPVHPLLHRPMRFMLVTMFQPFDRMHFLDTRRPRGLKSRQINGIGGHELLRDGKDIGYEPIKQIERHAFPNDHTEDLYCFCGRGKRVVLNEC